MFNSNLDLISTPMCLFLFLQCPIWLIVIWQQDRIRCHHWRWHQITAFSLTGSNLATIVVKSSSLRTSTSVPLTLQLIHRWTSLCPLLVHPAPMVSRHLEVEQDVILRLPPFFGWISIITCQRVSVYLGLPMKLQRRAYDNVLNQELSVLQLRWLLLKEQDDSG